VAQRQACHRQAMDHLHQDLQLQVASNAHKVVCAARQEYRVLPEQLPVCLHHPHPVLPPDLAPAAAGAGLPVRRPVPGDPEGGRAPAGAGGAPCAALPPVHGGERAVRAGVLAGGRWHGAAVGGGCQCCHRGRPRLLLRHRESAGRPRGALRHGGGVCGVRPRGGSPCVFLPVFNEAPPAMRFSFSCFLGLFFVGFLASFLSQAPEKFFVWNYTSFKFSLLKV